ncbi:hypothetical protein CDL15_Pgr009044 [Punica granatum]|nr:hypothetical protein CDL15_Pgr009044 [Punica granatum]PKI66650.1 hypothetical protein CRG98_012992 [Punica granatum]
MNAPLVVPVTLSCTFLLPLLLWWRLFIARSKRTTRRPGNLPPGPWKLPLIGNLHQLGPLPHHSLARLSRKYGPIMFLQFGSIPTLVISSDEMAQEVFKTHDRAFSGRPAFFAARKLTYNCSDVSFGPYGDTWKALRKIVVLELLSTKRVQSFQSVRDEEIALMLDTIHHSSSAGPINLSEVTMVLSNNVVCRATFGKRFYTEGDGRTSKFYETTREIQNVLGGFCVADLFPRLDWFNKLNGLKGKIEKNFRQLDLLYDEVIEEHKDPRRPKPEHEDLVDVLLRLQKDPNQEIRLTDDNIKGTLTDMFNAGTDTSSATLVWTMAELIKNPSVLKKVTEEVREAVKGKPKVEETDLPSLTYLRSVIKEGLRLHPPVPLLVPRETIESCKIMGYEIPAKTTVFVNALAIATDPKIWESPMEFRPERFLNSSVDFRGTDFQFLPFGAGRRGCPGISFGVVLIELALANLLSQFEWSLPEGIDLDMEEVSGLTTHKKTPLCLIATPHC